MARGIKQYGCSVEGCSGKHKARGWCRAHYLRWWKHGDVAIVKVGHGRGAGSGPDHPRWVGDAVSYEGMHGRLRSLRGTPSECEDCGSAEAPSYQWALDWRKDPDVVWGDRDGYPMPYSTNLSDYRRLCAGCHWKLDHPDGRRTSLRRAEQVAA